MGCGIGLRRSVKGFVSYSTFAPGLKQWKQSQPLPRTKIFVFCPSRQSHSNPSANAWWWGWRRRAVDRGFFSLAPSHASRHTAALNLPFSSSAHYAAQSSSNTAASSISADADDTDDFEQKFGPGKDGLVKWMKSFYTNPAALSGYICPALVDFIMLPPDQQLLTGPPSLSTAWFFAKALKHLPVDVRLAAFYELSIFANENDQRRSKHREQQEDQETRTNSKQQKQQGQHETPQMKGHQLQTMPTTITADALLDTLVRAFYLMDEEEMDKFLEAHVQVCLQSLSEVAAAGDKDGSLGLAKGCVLSFLPPPKERQRRAEIWTWPLPAFDLQAFEEEIFKHEFPIFACTRDIYFDLQRLKFLKEYSPPEYDRSLPIIASALSGRIHDSLWSVFFATGEAACIFRLIDMAACSFSRYQSLLDKEAVALDGGLGQTLRLMQSSASNDMRSVLKLLPTKDHQTTLYIMSGLSACWSLMENTRAHSSVASILQGAQKSLAQRQSAGLLTAEEGRAFNVLQLLTTQAGIGTADESEEDPTKKNGCEESGKCGGNCAEGVGRCGQSGCGGGGCGNHH